MDTAIFWFAQQMVVRANYAGSAVTAKLDGITLEAQPSEDPKVAAAKIVAHYRDEMRRPSEQRAIG